MLVIVLAAALLVAVCALALMVATFRRVAGNVGPLTLEELARRQNVTLVPIGRELAERLGQAWSNPLRFRIARDPRNPVLGELIVTENLDDPPTH